MIRGVEEALAFLNRNDGLRNNELLDYLIYVETNYGLTIRLKSGDISKLRHIIQGIDDMMQEEYVEGDIEKDDLNKDGLKNVCLKNDHLNDALKKDVLKGVLKKGRSDVIYKQFHISVNKI